MLILTREALSRLLMECTRSSFHEDSGVRMTSSIPCSWIRSGILERSPSTVQSFTAWPFGILSETIPTTASPSSVERSTSRKSRCVTSPLPTIRTRRFSWCAAGFTSQRQASIEKELKHPIQRKDTAGKSHISAIEINCDKNQTLQSARRKYRPEKLAEPLPSHLVVRIEHEHQ